MQFTFQEVSLSHIIRELEQTVAISGQGEKVGYAYCPCVEGIILLKKACMYANYELNTGLWDIPQPTHSQLDEETAFPAFDPISRMYVQPWKAAITVGLLGLWTWGATVGILNLWRAQ